MSTRDYSCKRIEATLAEIDRLKEGDFPYGHSREALEKICSIYERDLLDLKAVDDQNDVATINRVCAIALSHMFRYLPFLGFVLRSTNVRNAFEVYRPLLDMASDVLEPGVPRGERKTRLLLSSEWDYSPFIYKEITTLPDFVFIGLPAPESGNPFLLPMAGHELGHRVWAKKQLATRLKIQVQQEVQQLLFDRWFEFQQVIHPQTVATTATASDLFVLEVINWTSSVTYLQAEESFCDFLGLRIFGASYLHGFAYLLSPTLPGRRSLVYPNILKRVFNLLEAAQNYRVAVPNNYIGMFQDQREADLPKKEQFLLSIADASLVKLVPTLIHLADQAITEAGVADVSEQEAQRIYARLSLMIPAEKSKSLANILNAGWIAYNNSNLWNDVIPDAKLRSSTLKELVLKNIEVFQIEQIMLEAK